MFAFLNNIRIANGRFTFSTFFSFRFVIRRYAIFFSIFLWLFSIRPVENTFASFCRLARLFPFSAADFLRVFCVSSQDASYQHNVSDFFFCSFAFVCCWCRLVAVRSAFITLSLSVALSSFFNHVNEYNFIYSFANDLEFWSFRYSRLFSLLHLNYVIFHFASSLSSKVVFSCLSLCAVCAAVIYLLRRFLLCHKRRARKHMKMKTEI